MGSASGARVPDPPLRPVPRCCQGARTAALFDAVRMGALSPRLDGSKRLSPNSSVRSEDPATCAGSDSPFLAFLSGKGGFEPPKPVARPNAFGFRSNRPRGVRNHATEGACRWAS